MQFLKKYCKKNPEIMKKSGLILKNVENNLKIKKKKSGKFFKKIKKLENTKKKLRQA